MYILTLQNSLLNASLIFNIGCNHSPQTYIFHFKRLHIRIQIFHHFSMGHTHQIYFFLDSRKFILLGKK